MTDKTLDEHAAEVEASAEMAAQHHPGRTAPWRAILAAYKAERAARVEAQGDVKRLQAYASDLLAGVPMATIRVEGDGAAVLARAVAAEARVRELEAEMSAMASECDKAEARVRELTERLSLVTRQRDEAEARTRSIRDRVRELEAERSGLVTAEAYGQATAALAEDLAETRAHLARLREAVEAYLTAVSDGQADTLDPRPDVVRAYDAAERALRAALSTPGPTLAEIRRAAQVEVLRDTYERASAQEYLRHPSQSWLSWLRQRADDLEAGRG